MGCTGDKTYKEAVTEELKRYFHSLKLSSAQEKDIKNFINQDLNKRAAALNNYQYIYREDDAKKTADEYKKIVMEKFHVGNIPLTDYKSTVGEYNSNTEKNNTNNNNQNKNLNNTTNNNINNKSSNENFIESNLDNTRTIQNEDNIEENKLRNNPNLNKEAQEEDKNEKKIIKNKDENLKIDARIEMIWKMEESNIGKIYELSNNRIAVIKIEENDSNEELKIYSLDTFKLLSGIKFKEKSRNIIELENQDLVRSIYSSLEFYKLSGEKYELFQKIEEEKINIYFILGLMDGNLVSFNTNGIEIYSKEKDNYKSISKFKMEDVITNSIEIERNKLVIYKESSEAQKSKYFAISFFDLANAEEKILVKKEVSFDFQFLNFFKNDNYLFVNCQKAESSQESEQKWSIEYLNVGYVYNLLKEKYLESEVEIPPIEKRIAILCNYNNDLFIAKKGKIIILAGQNYYNGEGSKPSGDENQLHLIKFENKTFTSYRKLPFEIGDLETIIKLKNNNFMIYSSREIKLYKSN